MLFYSQYGGDAEHTKEKAKFIYFEKNKLKLADEIVIFKPEISRYENRVSIHGYYIISLCNVCDGWSVANEEDVFKIPMYIEVSDRVNYYEILHGEEEDRISSIKRRFYYF